MRHPIIEEDTGNCAAGIHITVTSKGPYLVYGQPPLTAQYIMPDNAGESWYFQEGRTFSTGAEPTALCRCGASRRKPYCDGSHASARWDPTLSDPMTPDCEQSEITTGETLTMIDRGRYCVLAGFCRARGGAWELTKRSDDPEARELALREASMCPGGRLTVHDTASGKPYEYRFEPNLGLIEEVTTGFSGGLWVRGRIPLRRDDGVLYGLRNRMVLCRCGHSADKPFCDGSHVTAQWHDGLGHDMPRGEKLPGEEL